jgi:hypothetical protein
MLGFSSFSEFPFATVANDNNVIISVTGNQLNITIGSVGIIADSIVEDAVGSQVTLGLGTLSISGGASFSVTGNPTTLGIGTITVTAAANVSPTGNALTIATGNVTVSGSALVNPTGSSLVLDSKEPGIITWNDIIPGVNMVWTPIEPYYMASNYSSDLTLELITTGEKAGLWGSITNTNLQILQQAASGYATVSMSGGSDVTLSLADGS